MPTLEELNALPADELEKVISGMSTEELEAMQQAAPNPFEDAAKSLSTEDLLRLQSLTPEQQAEELA